MTVAIWLSVLAHNPCVVPRKLIYVVNRRTVVDQTSDEVLEMLKRLEDLPIKSQLADLAVIDAEGSPVAVSTLRGQMADNRLWSADPCRPAIIVGTVDMIGSRLLFGGYRIGFKLRPLHAGFLGQDAVLIHDEAHLEPAFQQLLEEIEAQQERDEEAGKLRVVALTATQRGDKPAFELEDDDLAHSVLAQRINARKNLRLHPVDSKAVVEKIVERTLAHQGSGEPILVYVRNVADVKKVVAAIGGKGQPMEGKVLTLTGTMRGFERDGLEFQPVFRRFLPDKESDIDGTVCLVCTSAGEVGVNLSAKHLVCDLTTFESMAQRFGRVNRFGDPKELPEGQQTWIDVVHPKKLDEKARDFEALARTLEILNELNGDASPRALGEISAEKRRDAFSPLPEIPKVSDILFDAWTLTSIRKPLPGRPPLEPFLHGITDADPPQTQVAWRAEVELIDGDLLTLHPAEELLADYPLKPQELLCDRSDRVFAELKKIANRIAKDGQNPRVWLVDMESGVQFKRGAGKPLTISWLIEQGKEAIENKTLLLPPKVGGLDSAGFLSGSEKPPKESLDVADEWWFREGEQTRRVRQRVKDSEELELKEKPRLIRQIQLSDEENEAEEDEPKVWRWYELPWGGDGGGENSAPNELPLNQHLDDVTGIVRGFVNKLDLDDEIGEALILAARWHDQGKDRDIWQRGIGNPNPQNRLAKSGPGMRPVHLSDYRHELGSVIDVALVPEFEALSDRAKDLVLHLIAAHHGRARPHFPANEVVDPERGAAAAASASAEAPRRFESLQRRYGRWGLAYVESLLRAADYAASAGKSVRKEGLEP